MTGRGSSALLFLLLSAAGCPAPGPRPDPVPVTPSTPRPASPAHARCTEAQPRERASCYKPWTVLVYMAADNDLAPYAFLNLYEMESTASDGIPSASSERTDVVLQLDTPGPRGLRRIHVLPVGERYDDKRTLAQLTQQPEGAFRSPVVEQLPEGTDPARDLSEFLTWGARRYPAEHYMVVVWGHGQGWAPAQTGANLPPPPANLSPFPAPKEDPFGGRFRGGLGFDWSPPGFVDIPSLRGALLKMQRIIGRPVDIYVSDACLMQGIEVATELADSARYLIGSAYIQDFVGLPYRTLLRRLNTPSPERDADADPASSVAAQIPPLFQESIDPAKNPLRGQFTAELRRRFTLSALSTEALRRELLPALSQLGAALDAYQAEDPLHAGDLLYIIREQTGLYGSIQDLGAFLGALQAQLGPPRPEPDKTPDATERLRRALKGAQTALTTAVPAYAHGTDYRGDGLAAFGLRGLSVWLPVSESDFRTRITDYRAAALYKLQIPGSPKDTKPAPWAAWIERLYPSPN